MAVSCWRPFYDGPHGGGCSLPGPVPTVDRGRGPAAPDSQSHGVARPRPAGRDRARFRDRAHPAASPRPTGPGIEVTLRPRLRPLVAERLAELPLTCSECPLGATVRAGVEADHGPPGWARAAQQEWGLCGITGHEDGRLAGHLLFCPPLHVPRNGPQGGGPRSPDAAVVLSIRIDPGGTAEGLGRQLVQAAAARMVRVPGIHALEVRGSRHGGSCVLPPVEFLERVGFQVSTDHPLQPQLRLELSRTLRWRPGLLDSALDRVTGWIRPLPPEPANHQPHGG
ncbi:hypothetical protein CGZ98_08150 [Enemella evansiae]|nr:hypothetical protein CGZ98_08150 [Enemella evansiae]